MKKIILQIKNKSKIMGIHLWTHKFLYLLISIIIILLSVFLSAFIQLFMGGKQDDQLKYDAFSPQLIAPTDVSVNEGNSFVGVIYTDWSQSIVSKDKTYYFTFGYRDEDYYNYLININEQEWKYFNIFHLGQNWKNKWHFMGPLENVAKESSNSTSSSSTNNFKTFFFNNDKTSEDTKYDTNIRNFIDNLLTVETINGVKNVPLSYKTYDEKNTLTIPLDDFSKKILQNGSVTTDAGSTRALRYDQLSNAPFMLTIKAGKISIINALLTESQISSLG